MNNPAINLYRFWRETIRFHNETTVEHLRVTAESRPGTGATRPSVEQWSLDTQKWATASSYAPLDYRMGLSVTGLSAKHLDPGALIEPTLDEYEPVITMNVGCRRRRYALMTLWPNGDFRLDDLPSTWYQIFPRWTFFRTSYAAGRRVWMLPTSDETSHRWVALDETNWQVGRLYVPNYAFVSGGLYRLEKQPDAQWKFTAIHMNAVPDVIEQRAAEYLDKGYARTEQRYARHRRASERSLPASKQQRLALYIPKHGRMTGLEAVAEMTRHMRVFPAPMPEEAADGSDNLVASTVHR